MCGIPVRDLEGDIRTHLYHTSKNMLRPHRLSQGRPVALFTSHICI